MSYFDYVVGEKTIFRGGRKGAMCSDSLLRREAELGEVWSLRFSACGKGETSLPAGHWVSRLRVARSLLYEQPARG